MFDRLKKLFSGKPSKPEPIDEGKVAEAWNERKSQHMEIILGREHDMVMHAIIPYAIGGGLDLYYYPHGIIGTAIATKELSELPNSGSSNRRFTCYELAMFTRFQLDLEEARDETTPFGKAHSNINIILNQIAPYSATASLNEWETCAFPTEMEKVGGKCLIFDSYGAASDEMVQSFGVLAIIEVFPSEMAFARSDGGAELIGRLKAAGYYPYSDLDREPVA